MKLKNLFHKKEDIRADVFAKIFFSESVLSIFERTNWKKFYEENKSKDGFQNEIYQKQLLIGSIAIVFLAMSNHYDKEGMDEVIQNFRQLSIAEIMRRHKMTEDESDSLVIAQTQSLNKLIFTNPETIAGITFDWSKAWLLEMGIQEYNPITLVLVGHAWKAYFFGIAESLNEMIEHYHIVK